MACIRKRRGRWVIDFYDQYGKRRWQTLAEGKTKGDAKDQLREIEEKVYNSVKDFTRGAPQADDLTMVVVKMTREESVLKLN